MKNKNVDNIDYIKHAKMILDNLVFDKFNINYEISKEYQRRTEKWYLTLHIDVDVDRYVSFSPSYQQEYENYMNNIYDRIKNTLRYIDLQDYFGGILFYYVNDDETDAILYEYNQKLYRELENQYNVRPNEIRKADIFYYLYKSEGDQIEMHIELIGNNIEVFDKDTNKIVELVSCQQVESTMRNLIEGSLSIDIESYICQE